MRRCPDGGGGGGERVITRAAELARAGRVRLVLVLREACVPREMLGGGGASEQGDARAPPVRVHPLACALWRATPRRARAAAFANAYLCFVCYVPSQAPLSVVRVLDPPREVLDAACRQQPGCADMPAAALDAIVGTV